MREPNEGFRPCAVCGSVCCRLPFRRRRLDFDKIIPMPRVLDGTSTGMSDAMGSEGVADRPRDRVLPDHRLERLRAPLAREDLIRHRFKSDSREK